MSNSYLIGAMLDPLVVEFMSPAYREGMLEARIRTDEIRGNCPPRAGYVCVLDPRVKTGRYYRKQVKGEGVNALPPSRVEKALAQQEQRSQKGEGISFLGKATIAGGLAVGGLAVIGAIANSGRSTEPVPDIPDSKKPDTSVKPKPSPYEEGKQSAQDRVSEIAKEIKKAHDERALELANGVSKKSTNTNPSEISNGSPAAARKPRSSRDRETKAADLLDQVEQLKTAVQEGEPAPPLTKTTQVSPQPEAKAEKEINIPAGTPTRDASHAVIEANYSTIPDVVGKLNVGYKSAANIKNLLHENDILLRAKYANPTSDDKLSDTQQRRSIDGILDNGLIAKDGYLVQKIAGKGGYGKDLTAKIRIPAFMSIEDFDNAVQGIEPPQKKGERVRSTPEARIKAADDLIEAINEKVSKSPSLTTTEKQALDFYKTRVERQRENDLVEKEPKRVNDKVGEKPVKTPVKPKVVQPEFKEGSPAAKIMGVLGEDTKAIGQSFKSMDDKQQVKLNKLADDLSPDEAKTMAGYLRGLNFNNVKITGAAANRTAFAKRLEAIALVKANPTPPVVTENPPAIAEKPPLPVDPNTTQITPLSQPPRARPTSVKPTVNEDYAAAQKAQRASDESGRIARQTERIKANADDLKRQLDMKEIDADAYNKAIGLARQDLDDNGYFRKVSPTYAQLDDEIKGVLGIDNYRHNANWTNSSVEAQKIAYEKLEEIKKIERITYKELGLNAVKDPNSTAQLRAATILPTRKPEKAKTPPNPKSPVEVISPIVKEPVTQVDPVKNPPIIGGVKTYRMTDLTSGWLSRENMNSVQVGDRIIGREFSGFAKGGIVVDKLVLDRRNGEAIREFSKKYGEDNVITDVHHGAFAFTKENINISKDGKIEIEIKLRASTPPVEASKSGEAIAPSATPPVEPIKQPEVKAPKPQNKRSSKKQAPKPEDFPLDIRSAMNNVKIMESDLKNNEVLLEKWLNEKVVEVNPQKIANLKKKIANQKKDIKAKQEEVFDYIAKTQQPKQNNDAIASHETYYNAREQAKRDALRRFAA